LPLDGAASRRSCTAWARASGWLVKPGEVGLPRHPLPLRGILGVVTASRVDVLIYAFFSMDERHDFSRAAARDVNLGGFNCYLERGTLVARPEGHYPDVERAREALDPHLRAWELRAELEDAIRIEFRFDWAQGAFGTQVALQSAVGVTDKLTVVEEHRSYPPPSPKALEASAVVEDLLGWVRDLRGRRQPMLVLAYLFLTRLEFDYDDRAEAAAALNVSQPVLNVLGRLSEKNDPDERRKVKRRRPVERLTEAERQWLLAALPRLALQVSEVEAAGSAPTQLTMRDLPSL
jgi:hypothetical protein